MTDDDWIRRHELFDEAMRVGDLDGMRRATDNPEIFPNGPTSPPCGGFPLIYALYHGSLSVVRALLELGADPDADPQDGFPPLHAAIDSGAADRIARLRLLLEFGADPQQRGANDFTALHKATCVEDLSALELLLAFGADVEARTRIDHYETPVEHALRWKHEAALALLERHKGQAETRASKRSKHRERRKKRRLSLGAGGDLESLVC